ncbi:MAG: MOSC domain-containing protein [Acidihalobacter sp.]
MSLVVERLYRYPVKGLSPEALAAVTLEAGRCLPHDRRFALARSDAAFDPTHPVHLPKTHFFMLMRDERLAELGTRFDAESGDFEVARGGEVLLSVNLDDSGGREAVERFFAEFLGDAPGVPPKLVEAPGHAFGDARNVYFSGLPARDELDWVDGHLRIGGVRLHVVSPITRCAATTVNPATARRDVNVPRELMQHFGHNYMGVYAEVLEGGELGVGDALLVESA